jgi:hypothetical protein
MAENSPNVTGYDPPEGVARVPFREPYPVNVNYCRCGGNTVTLTCENGCKLRVESIPPI